jgi:hypothetical protein
LALAPLQLRGTSPNLLDEQEDESLACPSCRHGRLRLISETPHPLYGVLGVTECMLRCDSPDCGKVVVLWLG